MLKCNVNSHEQAVNLQPLTDAELDKLADLLKRFGDKRAMNLEMLDPNRFCRSLSRWLRDIGTPPVTPCNQVTFSCRCYLMMRVASLAPMIGLTASCAEWR
jgi:hypothetical protein